MSQTTLRSAIENLTASRHYGQATVERWLTLAANDAQALLDLVQELRLGENQLRDLWEWAEEIAARDGQSLAGILTAPSVVAARARKVGRNDRLKLVKEALRRLRYPRLIETEQRLQELLAALELPRDIGVTLPAFLEGDTLKIEIQVANPRALKAMAQALERAAESPACADIFALLEEAP